MGRRHGCCQVITGHPRKPQHVDAVNPASDKRGTQPDKRKTNMDNEVVSNTASTTATSAGTSAPNTGAQNAEIAEIIGSSCYAGAVNDPTAGHLHPLNLSLGIAALHSGWKI